MLERTFIHIPGIGPKTERAIWLRGIETWDHFLNLSREVFSLPKDEYVREQLRESKKNLGNIRFFKERLCANEIWRLYGAFRDKAVYLDIETTGGYQGVNDITVVGLYDGKHYRAFVNGKNLEQFESVISEFDLVITFNGSAFDLPFIRKWFRHITLPPAHIDLRFLLRKIGYRGGLKKIEKQLRINREAEIRDMNGYDAVMLWKAHQWGDDKALDLLVQYNKADVINLEPLMTFSYEEMKRMVLPRRVEDVQLQECETRT